MEQHKEHLSTKCRVCARKATSKPHNKNSDICKRILSSVYGVDVEGESEEVFPPSICNSCFLVLRRASIENDKGPILMVHSWLPHGELCEVCAPSNAGRKKKTTRGRPSDSDPQYISRNIIRKINTIQTTVFAEEGSLENTLFLPSPFLDYLLCKHCHCIPYQPIELLTCRHYLCTPCIRDILKLGTISCPCSEVNLTPDQLCAPSELTLNIMGSLLIRCNMKCGQVLELKHLKAHLQSNCTKSEIPPPYSITVEQLLVKYPDREPPLMVTHTMGLLTEKMLPSGGHLTCRSSSGKVQGVIYEIEIFSGLFS